MAAARTTIAHVTLQPVENDARVRRAVTALQEAGYACPLVGPGYGVTLPAMTRLHKARLALAYGTGGRLGERVASAAFFRLAAHRQALAALRALAPDAIHAHDWDGAIVASAAATELGVPFAYDAHEYAAEMHAERRGWLLAVAPLIRTLEEPAARRAAFVIAVSDAIGHAMTASLGLKQTPVTIRNIPEGEPSTSPISTVRHDILLHYHGILARGRGIETALEALTLLPKRYRLRLTGPWRQPAFETEMRATIATQGLSERVELIPALPPENLVAHAAEADIGLCLLAGRTLHDRGALPNKLFEYLQAGLPVIASGSDEVADILKSLACGISVPPSDPAALASAVTALDAPGRLAMAQNAAVAGRELTWENEKARLVEAWRSVLPPRDPGLPS